MRIGISMASAYGVDDARAGARYMVERARAAHAADLDSLFVGDHHATPAPYYQNSPILGRVLAEWGEREAGALYLLPLWNPVLVAEQTGTLASIAQGPFVLQCAIGGGRSQFASMGIGYGGKPAKFEEALSIIRALWRGETVDGPEGHWPVAGARIAPLPPEPIEVWIGASAQPAIDRAARLGDAWLGSPGTTLAQTRRQLDWYRESCAAHGRAPERVALRRDVYVGESVSEARSTMRPYVEGRYRGFDPEALVIGDVPSVADQLAAYAELGFTDILVRNITADQARALATIERLARVREALA